MNKKTAFTLAEMLLVLGILGILMAVTVAVMKPQEAARKALISSALTSLDKAMYNGYANLIGEDNPFSEENIANPVVLCKAIAFYANTIEDDDNVCKGTFIKTFTDDTIFKPANRDTYLAFTLSSGMHVFISDRQIKDDNGIFFYLVYVDLNGKKGPNTTILKKNSIKTTYPDIYVFAIIPLGRVIPLGILEDDAKLLTAKPNQIKNKNVTETIGSSTTYAKAKSQAWGFYTNNKKIGSNLVQTDISQQPTGDVASMDEEPYAYNDLIRNFLAKKGEVTFYKNLTFPINNNENFNCADIPNDEFYDGSCSIEIDTYAY